MVQKSSTQIILQEFFDSPTRNFSMRELSRKAKIAQPSTLNILRQLVKEKLIIRDENGLYPTYNANRDDELFKIYKKQDLILRLHESGLINYLYDSCMPATIILFGSASLGEDIESSDIDIYLQCKERKLELAKYEKALNRNISGFFDESLINIPVHLKNNIINGIVLKGYVDVFSDGTDKSDSKQRKSKKHS